MAIMQSCCCWRSVRRGSFACAVYTVLYYSVLAVTIASVLQEESQYLAGNRSLPKSNSVLEPGVSPVTMRFNFALLICSSSGVICCLLLLYGLFRDEKLFLVPWICIVIVCSIVDISHLIYLFFFVSLDFNPITAMVITLDFFLLCLNAPAVRYTVQPTTTATSCLSSRRALTNNETRITATATPTQSPTAMPAQLNIERSPGGHNSDRQRKHVQFPDDAPAVITDKTDEALATQLKPDELHDLEQRNGNGSLWTEETKEHRNGRL
ncbi:uncharacterized protein LOC100680166 isoform X5 [Nasonia vitripennis]|uniref:Uncharacterized protein n=1 Tax=Nasonia vitripennis TaxID=7425 RepID=A0A7M7IX08_NASVI|nr:uncharacterized protein LOC100680166 isoform X5 [Nasonia vitripennis]